MSLEEMQDQLRGLQSEQALASLMGVTRDGLYMAGLKREIDAASNAYVASAVTMIASFRAQISGPQVG